jgi:hypothetical protein
MMKVKQILDKLDEFESLLKEFDRARKDLMGRTEDDDPLARTTAQAHYAFDDVRLALLRKYRSLQPYIRRFSRCFTFVGPDGETPQETYEVVIEHGTISFEPLYRDLDAIRNHLRSKDPATDLDGERMG